MQIRIYIEAKEVKKADLDFTVGYKINGRIIPVDSKGNLLSDVAQPLYVTDPDDATKVLQNQGVPRIMNYVPEQESVMIRDANKDTKVKYYTFNEWSELKTRRQKVEQKGENLKTEQPKENKNINKKSDDKVEEKLEKTYEKEIKSSKKDTGLKSMFSWLK